jgi:peptidoglycan/LPS O-acetylase OafA/YrhL
MCFRARCRTVAERIASPPPSTHSRRRLPAPLTDATPDAPHRPAATVPREGREGAADRPRYVPALDGLRGFAILAVLLLHFTSALTVPHGVPARLIKQLFNVGWTGVDLFFVLSGFLITGILSDTRGTHRRFRTFYARRALRILPLYYGYLAVLFTVPVLLGARAYITPVGDQLPYWLFLQNFRGPSGGFAAFSPHLWSLAIEEQFYLVWPLVVFALSRRAALRVCAACVAGALAYRVACVLTVDDLRTVFFLTPGRVDGLAMGGMIALIARGEGGPARLRKAAPLVLAASLAVIAAAALHPSGFNPGGAYMVVAGYSALAAFFGAVLVLALDEPRRSPLARLLSGRVPRFFGRYSYGLYVLHVPLVALARMAGVSADRMASRWELAGLLGYVALMTAATVGVALLSWTLWERPFLKLRGRFAYETPPMLDKPVSW